jgi:hypothetical protein
MGGMVGVDSILVVGEGIERGFKWYIFRGFSGVRLGPMLGTIPDTENVGDLKW